MMQAAVGRVAGRLEHHRVACRQRRRDLVRHRVQRRVERRDRADDAQRHAQREAQAPGLARRAFDRHHLAAEVARLLGRQAEGLDAAPQLVQAVAGRKADLDLQRAHQLVAALFEQRGGAVEDRAALVRRQRAGAEGRVGRGHGLAHLLARGQVDRGAGLQAVLVERAAAARAVDPAAGDQQPGIGQRQRRVPAHQLGPAGAFRPGSRRLRPAR